MDKKDIYSSILAQKGLRITAVRVKALKILDDAEVPITAEEMFTSLKNVLPSVNLSTVYRTMETLLKNGLVVKTTLLDDAKARYEFKRVEHQHHIVCICCNRMVPIENCPIDDEYAESMCRKEGFELTGHRFEIYGLCSNCKKTG